LIEIAVYSLKYENWKINFLKQWCDPNSSLQYSSSSVSCASQSAW
jgi:hypothetical protein